MGSTADPNTLQAYDNTLLAILQHEAGVEQFLDVMFGFLSRRTDFYHLMKDPKQRYGFPAGVAEKMTQKYFKKYQDAVRKAQKKADVSKEEKSKADAAKIEEVKETSKDTTKEVKLPVEVDKAKEASKEEIPQPKLTKEDGTLNQEAFQSNPDSYNGAMTDKYSWSQNYDDVDVQIPVEASVVGGKQVSVDIQRKHLVVKLQTTPSSEFETVIEGDLEHEVNREESMWSLEKSKAVIITLTKDKNIWWTKLVEGDKAIDIQKICPERSMADMDQEEKAVINKLQFDENQKRMGLPQSHEIKVHDILKKGWDAEGSPFKGQDFDPKMFNIAPGSVGQ